MAGVKGRSGTNKGKEKPWADALRLAAMANDAEGIRKLRRIAEKCVDAAMAGDMQAMKEVGDRLDGRPAQEATVTFDDRRDLMEFTDQELIEILKSGTKDEGAIH